VGAVPVTVPRPLLSPVQQPADPRGQTRQPCLVAAAASAARVIRSAPSNHLGFGFCLDFVCVEPEHLGRVRAVVHQPAVRVAHMVLTARRRVPPRQRMMRPARKIDDRAASEDRFHIGIPAPGHDLDRRWQYAEGGAGVAASARNVLGVADSTPICHVRANSGKHARVRPAEYGCRVAGRCDAGTKQCPRRWPAWRRPLGTSARSSRRWSRREPEPGQDPGRTSLPRVGGQRRTILR
jgi:hypothetical protein